MKRIASVAIMAAAITGLGFGVAEAHPRLLSANPAPNAQVASPFELRMGFSETLIGKFSRIALMDGRGHRIKIGATTLAPNHKQLIAPVGAKLSPGTYKIAWNAVSTDTHRVQGTYAFTVRK
jgi:methionine-rich copper-binding protein CopC